MSDFDPYGKSNTWLWVNAVLVAFALGMVFGQWTDPGKERAKAIEEALLRCNADVEFWETTEHRVMSLAQRCVDAFEARCIR